MPSRRVTVRGDTECVGGRTRVDGRRRRLLAECATENMKVQRTSKLQVAHLREYVRAVSAYAPSPTCAELHTPLLPFTWPTTSLRDGMDNRQLPSQPKSRKRCITLRSRRMIEGLPFFFALRSLVQFGRTPTYTPATAAWPLFPIPYHLASLPPRIPPPTPPIIPPCFQTTLGQHHLGLLVWGRPKWSPASSRRLLPSRPAASEKDDQ